MVNNTVNNNYVMASFDVQSLFTNIPIPETIDIILNEIFSNSDEFHNYYRATLKELLNICMTNNLFLFNEKLFFQKDGAPMGGCCSPTLANIFMSYHEQRWLQACPPDFKPVVYKRYIDDTFLLFKSETHIQQFLPILKFTTH